MKQNDLGFDLQIFWCGENEIEWVNEQYKKINFKLSNLKTDRIVIATYKKSYVGLGRLCQIENGAYELGGIYVDPDYRELGIAKKIIQFLLESKIKDSIIYCLPFSHLRNFYESKGFQEVSKEDVINVPKEILEKHLWCNKTYPHQVLLLKLK